MILCGSVVHAFRRNAFTDVSLLMSYELDLAEMVSFRVRHTVCIY